MQNAIICGFGALGEKLADSLTAQGMKIYGIRRSQQSYKNVEMIYSDIFKLSYMPTCHYLFYFIPPESKHGYSYRKAYIHGLRHIMSLLSKHPSPPKIILRSSLDIYQDTPGEQLSEATPIQVRKETTHALLQAETMLAQSGYQYLVLRLPILKEHLLRSLTQKLLKQKISYAKRQNPIHFINCNSAADAITQLMTQNGIFNICTTPIAFNTLLAKLSTQMGLIPYYPKCRQYYAYRPTISFAKVSYALKATQL
ncbi:hypothetical protein OAT84_01810 [Gammaproteobacteria bacterium]|nr:hypothetical protein [Gammaproteobacteria bacterium]